MGSVDSPSGGGIGIDTLHARVHAGEMFDVDFVDDVWASAEVHDIGITTPAGESIHIRLGASAGNSARAQFYEASTFTVGTPLTPQNANRESTKTTDTAFVSEPTISVLGNLIRESIFQGGSGGNAPGFNLSSSQEIILKPDTMYILRLSNLSGGSTQLALNLQYYEVDAV